MIIATLRNAAVVTFTLVTGIAIAPASAQVDTDLPLGISFAGDAPGGTPPWVNVLFRDFDNIPDFGTFNWIKNTVEVQVTTAGGFYDEPGGSCCGVQGKGNLTGRENLKALWLNVHPRVDISKLKLYWTGESMPPGTQPGACDSSGCADKFPAAGLRPTDIEIARNKFKVGPSGCDFDILIQWKGKNKLGQDADHSKLLLVYDDANQDIDPSDFTVASDSCKRNRPGVFIGVGHVQNTSGGEGSGWIKDGTAVVEPVE
jgi:hypothetical protein